MEHTETTSKIVFVGSTSAFYLLKLKNLIFTVFTLGLYYPWAKAATLRFYYENTLFQEKPFAFTGTGKEMFVGFIKAIALLAVLYGGYFSAIYFFKDQPVIVYIATLTFSAVILILIPLVIHGRMRYLLSRSEWTGIRFGYRGNLFELYKVFAMGILLTLVTFGIYSSWFTVKLRRYLIGHSRMGNVLFDYEGKGSNLFFIHLSGIFLSIITLGIYGFWYIASLIKFYVNHLRMIQGEEIVNIQTKLSGSKILVFFLLHFPILLFSLGLAYPWILLRAIRLFYKELEVIGHIDETALLQTEEPYKNATGEDMADMLDLGIV